MSERKQVRQKTQHEKELESQPDCLYDVKELDTCRNFEFPPKMETCRDCLVRGITDYLMQDRGAAALSEFYSYQKFLKANFEQKRDE